MVTFRDQGIGEGKSGMDAGTEPAIRVEDLTVAYGEKPVLWDVDMGVPAGVLMAVIGPNGAGKTTLIKAIMGLVQPVAGYVSIFGKPSLDHRRLVG